MRIPKITAALCCFLLSLVAAEAQQATDTDQIDTVFSFNRICYTKVPSVKAIEDMALELAWKPLDEDALEAFGNKNALSYRRGWDVQIGEKFYRLGLTQGPVPGDMKTAFPDFGNGVATSCTLVLDGSDENAVIAANMQKLANKEPVSTNVQEGPLLTTTWSGGNDDFKVFLVNKASKDGEGGLLNVTVLSKQ